MLRHSFVVETRSSLEDPDGLQLQCMCSEHAYYIVASTPPFGSLLVFNSKSCLIENLLIEQNVQLNADIRNLSVSREMAKLCHLVVTTLAYVAICVCGFLISIPLGMTKVILDDDAAAVVQLTEWVIMSTLESRRSGTDFKCFTLRNVL
ncbi:hypothetical protein CHUAL_010908 [Chamberlinius hualienensis]